MRYGQELISKHKLALLMFRNVSLMSCHKHSGYYFTWKHAFRRPWFYMFLQSQLMKFTCLIEFWTWRGLQNLLFYYFCRLAIFIPHESGIMPLHHNAQNKKLLRISFIIIILFVFLLKVAFNFYMLLLFAN